MQFDQMLAALSLEEHADRLRPGWEESLARLPEGEIEYLTEAHLRHAAEPFGVSPAGVDRGIALARRVAEDPALRALFWHHHRVLFAGGRPSWEQVSDWPGLGHVLGEEASAFCGLVLLSGVPRMEREHRARRIPDEVVRATLADVGVGLEPEGRGRAHRLSPHMLGWFSNFLRAELYRLGRLQFQFGTLGCRLRAFRRRGTGLVLALSEDGVRYLPSGQLDPSGKAEEAWTATLTVDPSGAVGYPILPEGRVLQQQVTLPAAEWEQVLSADTPALNIHIPGGDGTPMAFEACGDSFRRALEFFPRYYPEFHFGAFVCTSWILNSWLATVLAPTSNMVRFQAEVYLVPSWLDKDELLHAAFHRGLPADLREAPRDTGLRRALVETLETGREIEAAAGGCFLRPEDLRWGEQVYRRQVLPFPR